jgi:hypothetical protein
MTASACERATVTRVAATPPDPAALEDAHERASAPRATNARRVR